LSRLRPPRRAAPPAANAPFFRKERRFLARPVALVVVSPIALLHPDLISNCLRRLRDSKSAYAGGNLPMRQSGYVMTRSPACKNFVKDLRQGSRSARVLSVATVCSESSTERDWPIERRQRSPNLCNPPSISSGRSDIRDVHPGNKALVEACIAGREDIQVSSEATARFAEQILVVEDDRAIQKALKRLFEAEDYRVPIS